MKKLVISLILGMAPVLAGAAGMADFSQCRQFFAHSAPPKVTATSDLKLRPLCYDAFAVMHSGRSKTPVYVAERLSRSQLVDARDESGPTSSSPTRDYREPNAPSWTTTAAADGIVATWRRRAISPLRRPWRSRSAWPT
jgi:hypothetical protein